jgi:phosphatidylserine decarboxylase
MREATQPTVLDRASTALLRVLPQHLLAAGMYRLMRAETPWLKQLLIDRIARHYGIDLDEAEDPDPRHYASFNAFFTRALRADARPIADDAVVSPADGSISQIGRIDGERLLQAKGHEFDLPALLGGDRASAAEFRNGRYVTVYLSPRDYHRVHLPLAGRLESMTFVPGDLFSVSEATTQLVSGLFARNERVICHFTTRIGPMAVVLVGAIFVGSMETVWHGEVHGDRGEPTRWVYRGAQRPEFATGAEIGRFNMGSTVIVLLPDAGVDWLPELQGPRPVRMGQALSCPLDAMLDDGTGTPLT